MSEGLQFNEETARKVEALYLTPDVVVQRGSSIRGPRCGNAGRVTQPSSCARRRLAIMETRNK